MSRRSRKTELTLRVMGRQLAALKEGSNDVLNVTYVILMLSEHFSTSSRGIFTMANKISFKLAPF